MTPDALPSWEQQLTALTSVAPDLVSKWGRPDPSEDELQDMNHLALAILAEGYLCSVNMDPNHPTWAPLWNIAFNQGGPVPDFVYMHTEINPEGTYRISGYRGTSRFVDFTLRAGYHLVPKSARRPTAVGTMNDTAPMPAYNVDDLDIDESGYFSVTLSAQRPEGGGDWWELPANARTILMRKCACDWSNEVDARVAIDRIDEFEERYTPMSAEEMARRFSDLGEWVNDTISFDMELAQYYRDNHPTNGIERSKVCGAGTGVGLQDQVYHDGTYELADDEVLVIETDLPKQSRYWQVLVADDRFCTVDWMNRQSSLNDAQAMVDSDGRLRAVISAQDPGVPNWLDKADNAWGVIQLRWNRASDFPTPVATKMLLSELRNFLPDDTPVVTPAERRELLLKRRQGAQLRQLW